MLNDMVIYVQRHTKVSKQTMLLDGIDVGSPPPPPKKKKNTCMWGGLNNLFMKYEQHHKCKGSLKTDGGSGLRLYDGSDIKL